MKIILPFAFNLQQLILKIFDYDPCRLLLAIRVPAPVHDLFMAHLKRDILRQIDKIIDGNDSIANLAKGIDSENSTLLPLEDGASRYPDARFRHVKAVHPGVIIEISNSQTTKDLGYLADQYIVETSGSVKVVVGIKLDYGRTLKAELSLWRPQIVEESGQKRLISRQEVSSEVREVKNLCLCVTDERRFFVGKTVPR